MTTNAKDNIKRRRRYDILPKILCFIAAFILWIYVTQVETSDYEETFNGISVELINTSVLESEAGLNVYSGHGNTVNVTVSGKKSDINRYTSESIKVFADVSEITESGRHTVPIFAETPNGLTVSEMSLSFINVYVDAISTVEVDIRPKILTAIIGDGCELGEITPEYSLVTLTGPKSVLNEIDYAQISLELGEINSTVSTIAPLELIGRNESVVDTRYVQLNRSEVKVTVPVYTTKEVPLTIDYKNGYYNDSNVKITYEPKTVQLKGDPAELSKISSISLGTLDEKTVTSDVMHVYKLVLPAGITSTENIETVNVTIAHIGTTVRSFSVDSIEVQGADKLKYEVLTKTLTVRVRGTKAELDKIEKENIKASVDLSEYGDSVSGTITVNADISISGAGKSYSVGEYPVQIKID